MDLKKIFDTLKELKMSGTIEEARLLSAFIETAIERKQETLSFFYKKKKEDFFVEFSHGSATYRITEPRYEEADFVKNRRRGPGGKYYPFIEIEFPCRVEVTSPHHEENLTAEGRINLHDGECTVDSTVVPVPEDAMEKIQWHCREYSFLLE